LTAPSRKNPDLRCQELADWQSKLRVNDIVSTTGEMVSALVCTKFHTKSQEGILDLRPDICAPNATENEVGKPCSDRRRITQANVDNNLSETAIRTTPRLAGSDLPLHLQPWDHKPLEAILDVVMLCNGSGCLDSFRGGIS
jgi:hypothetical protein